MDRGFIDSVERRELAELRSIEEVRKRLRMQEIFGESYRPKTKVRIAHSVSHFWNSIQTLAESFCQKDGLDVRIVLCPQDAEELKKMKQQMEKEDCRYVCAEDYQVEADKPDIAVFNVAHTDVFFKMWGGISAIRQNVSYVAVVPYDNSVKFESSDRINQYYDLLKELKPDFFAVASPIYPVIKGRYANTVQMDSPKFDVIHRKMQDVGQIPETWRKLNGKKVILWTTVHGHDEWYAGKFFVGVAFDLYIKNVLAYFQEHRETGLIFRPHPAYIQELVSMHGIWSEDDLRYIRDYFERSENMVWDDSSDYSCAFAVSDALLTDDGTGITLSYLPMRKPICILRRNRSEIYTGTWNVTENYYKAHDFSELEEYFALIGQGEDPLYERRMDTVQKFVPVFDGKNGERIADKIMDDFQKKI